MKHGNPCVKCGSKSIYYVPGGVGETQNQAVIGSFLPTRIRIARFICTDCGYSEEWVDRDSDLVTIRELSNSG
jgi:hypothetical protein